MFRKDLVFKTLAFFSITFLALIGCPNVVDDGDDSPPIQTQGDIEKEVAVAAGAATLGIELTDGSFAQGVAPSSFTIPENETGFTVGSTLVVSPGGKVLTIKGGTPATKAGNIKVTIKKEAFAATTVVTGDKVTPTIVGAQGSVSSLTSDADVATGANAIEVKLNKGVFNTGITGADFEHDNDSGITTTNGSTVMLSTDNKTATIYENGSVAAQKKARIGIKASALVGYPLVAAADVTITSTKGTDPYITQQVTPASGDTYIKVPLTGGTFTNTAGISNFILVPVPGTTTNTIALGTTADVKFNTDKTQAVIKLGSPSISTDKFWLKIATAALTPASTTVGSITTTKQATNLEKISLTGTGSKSGPIVVTIGGGGKFKSPLVVTRTGFQGGTTEVTFVSVTLNSPENTEATIVLSGAPASSTTLGVALIAADDLATDSWLVEADDITLAWSD
jgi:hypothetical protein